MPDFNKMLSQNPFGMPQSEKELWYCGLQKELTRFHYDRCAPYRKIIDRLVTKPDEDRFETSDQNIEQTNPIIRAQHLLPAKARILLMLALAVTKDPTDLQRIFSEY